MRIVVKSSDGKKIWLPIPSGLVFNPLTACFAPKFLKEQGIEITRAQAIAFVKELNRYRRKHPKWVLMEVERAEGDYVKIKL